MQGVSELIGLLIGITADNRIHELEIERVKDWVSRNRNLVYSRQQGEVIQLVENILVDYSDMDKVRALLYKLGQTFLDENESNVTVSVFLGIVDGIVSDHQVSGDEYRYLSNWIEQNRAYLENAGALIEIIDKLQNERTNTESSTFSELDELNKKVEDIRFNLILGFLKNHVQESRNIGIYLIDLLGRKTFVDRIHALAERELKSILHSYTGISGDKDVIFISLVLIAMTGYKGGNYYEGVRSTYQDLHTKFSDQKINGKIRSILDIYNLENMGAERQINIALSNAIVPAYYLPSFFEFIFDIYERNFEYQLSDALYEDFMFVYEGIRQMMLSEGDEISISATKKTYKLITTTKRLVSRDDGVDTLIRLSIIIVRLIDKLVWNKEFTIFNPYLQKGADDWLKTRKELDNSITRTLDFDIRSRWEPKFVLIGNNIYLVSPLHRVKGVYDDQPINVEVFNGEERIFSDAFPEVRDIIGGYQISVEKIRIHRPIGKITYRLTVDGKVVYDSSDKLHRRVLAFDLKGEEIKNNTDFEGNVVLCTTAELSKSKVFYKSEHFVLSSTAVRKGDVLSIDGMFFNFAAILKPGVYGDLLRDHYLYDERTSDKIQVYRSVEYLVFEYNTGDFSSEETLCVEVGGKIFSQQEFRLVTEREGVKKCRIDLEDISDGIHSVSLIRISKDKKKSMFSFMFAQDSHLAFEKEVRFNGRYAVVLESALIDSPIDFEVDASDYEEFRVKVRYGPNIYLYMIPFNFAFYSIDDGSWKYKTDAMWIGDIRSETTLRLSDVRYDAIQVFGSNGSLVENNLKLSDRDFAKEVRIGFLTSYKEGHDYLSIALLKDGEKTDSIVCYTKCVLEKIEYLHDALSKSVVIAPRYKGRGNVSLSVTSDSGEVVYNSDFIENGEAIIISEINPFKEYRFAFYEKKKGLSLKSKELLKEFTQVFYSPDDFVGNSFKISEVYYDQLIKSKFLRKPYFFKRTFVRILSREEDNVFTGEVYAKYPDSTFFHTAINPIRVEICGDPIEGTMEISLTKNGDGLLLDFQHRSIMNQLEHTTAVDIYSYIIHLRGVSDSE